MQQLTRLAITRYWATAAIFLALAVAGIASYFALPLNEFPKVNIPVVTVTTVYAGANPQDVEIQVTKPIEDAVAGLNDIDNITSVSGQGFSAVTVTFTDAADSTTISSDVQRQVNTVVQNFPSGVTAAPLVVKADLSQAPVMQLALVDDTLAPQDLYDEANNVVLPALEQVNGVSQVSLVGGQQDQVTVSVDPLKLAGYGVSLAQVQSALAAANVSSPGGSISQGSYQYEVEVNGLYTDPTTLGSVVISGTGSSMVHLSDIATVTPGAAQQTQVTRVNGHQAILLAIGQQNGSNLTDVTDSVNSQIPQVQSSLPSSSQLSVVEDETPFVRGSLDGIEEELVTAVILTSLVLLAFLHNPRAAVIVLVSIPTTLLTTFIAMTFLGFSLNFLSTLGLTLTIGILVDDSIVVLENVLRHLDRGDEPFDAALHGRAEIGLAAVAITFVDVVVFAPTGLVGGQIGGFFREFGFTIAAATLISLVVSFTLTPMLAAHFLRSEEEGTTSQSPLQRFGTWWDRGFARLERTYRRILAWSLVHRPVVLLVAAATVVLGIGLVGTGKVATDFVPTSDSGYMSVSTTAPPGTSLAAHDAAMREVEQILLSNPYVQTVTASIGVSSSGVFGSSTGGEARYGTVTVQLVSTSRPTAFALVDQLRPQLAQVPGITADVSVSGGQGGSAQPVAIRLQGPLVSTLDQLGAQLQDALAQTPGLVNVTNGAPAGQPEILITVDPNRAANVGVSTATIASAVDTAFNGVTATKYQKVDGTLENVQLELNTQARSSAASVGDLPIPLTTGQTVPLSAVSTITLTTGPTEIDHYDRQRVVTISADLDTGVVLGQVQPAVNKAVSQLSLPAGYTASLGGNSQEQSQSFGELFEALGVSVLLAYLLMAVLYNSLLHPLTILFSLPVAIGGAIVGLLVFGYSFSVFAMIGLILLVGLAIKNGILLVDRTNHNRDHGMSQREALLEAGPARLRPILMTSITIAIALFPTALKFGEGSELRAPLAAAVLGGVISSTLLTLVLVPVMYTLLNGMPGTVARGVGWLIRGPGRLGGLVKRRAPTPVLTRYDGHAHLNGANGVGKPPTVEGAEPEPTGTRGGL